MLFRRIRADERAGYEQEGWRVAAYDHSPSVGALLLLEMDMLNLPHFGASVKVWPAPGLRVQDGDGAHGRFLAPSGREVVWDAFFHRRFLDGSVLLHDPAPAPAPAKR
jgi:hypothetical protein